MAVRGIRARACEVNWPDSSVYRLGNWTPSNFVEQHPAISIELLLSDSYVDFVGEGIDIPLRFGQITDSSLRTRSLGPKLRLVCASPAYLPHDYCQVGRELQIQYFADVYPVRVEAVGYQVLYDPENGKPRS